MSIKVSDLVDEEQHPAVWVDTMALIWRQVARLRRGANVEDTLGRGHGCPDLDRVPDRGPGRGLGLFHARRGSGRPGLGLIPPR